MPISLTRLSKNKNLRSCQKLCIGVATPHAGWNSRRRWRKWQDICLWFHCLHCFMVIHKCLNWFVTYALLALFTSFIQCDWITLLVIIPPKAAGMHSITPHHVIYQYSRNGNMQIVLPFFAAPNMPLGCLSNDTNHQLRSQQGLGIN